MKKYLTILFITMQFSAFGQVVKGKIQDTNDEALVGATVVELGTTNGTITDINGLFELRLQDNQSQLVLSYVGFVSDTVQPILTHEAHYELTTDATELQGVSVTASSSFIDEIAAKHVEVISEAELMKAACCNLSESFETNASVDVSFTDAVTGSKTIQMLGLAGKYVQINRENIPHIRGLANRYGLGFVPGTWIQSIDVGKGSGSVVNGFESMTGQINLELKKPENSEKLYLNAYVNSFGRLEVNANHARDLGKGWSTALLFHSDYLNTEIDRNEDGFMDMPKTRQINLLNRYKHQSDKMASQIGVHFMLDDKAGGQKGFGFNDDFRTSSVYGFSNTTRRVEVFGKTGLLFPHKPYKGWGFIYSASYLDLEGGYGRNNYNGEESTVYGNVIYQNIIGNSFHQYRTGVSILYDNFNENFADSAFLRQEIVPGIYYEYTFIPNDRFTLVAGARSDFHNLYGTYFSPRLHLRYQLLDNTTFRLAAGRGYRTANVILENSGILVSSRAVNVLDSPMPEISWNFGGSLTTSVEVAGKDLTFTGDYFYTVFENQMIYDLENSSEINIYNLDGTSYAHSFQAEASFPFNEFLTVKGAYKYYDVKATINATLQEVPFNSKNRFFLNASYATRYDKWTADLTMQWIGTKRLPNTSDKPIEFQRPDRSPNYGLVNAQVSRGFRWGSIYLGSENLLNYTQDDPIIDPDNPFGPEFDASIVWAPIAGRMIYSGIRYKIKR